MRQGVSANALDYVSSPLGRARDTMELIRTGLGLDPSRYRMDDRLKEMSFGRWEGFTFPELQGNEADALAARDADKWGYVLPEGESYAQLQVRVCAWYESVDRDTVVASHGGVCRVLMAHLGILPNDAASTGNIAQGVRLRVRRRQHDNQRIKAATGPKMQNGRTGVRPFWQNTRRHLAKTE